MLKQRTNGLLLHQIMLLPILVFVLASCTNHKSGMSEWDYKSQSEGLVLHCTEVLEDKCITHQWVDKDDIDIYRRFIKNQ